MSMFEGFTDNLIFRVAIVVSIKVVVQVSAKFTNSIFALTQLRLCISQKFCVSNSILNNNPTQIVSSNLPMGTLPNKQPK